MPVTMAQVRQTLDPDEPDYGEAVRLGAEALPFLETLAQGQDPLLAAKAVHMAARIGGPQSAAALLAAASHPEASVRVAAADAAMYVEEQVAVLVMPALFVDADVGVRRATVRSAATFGHAMTHHLERVSGNDPDPRLRMLARRILER